MAYEPARQITPASHVVACLTRCLARFARPACVGAEGKQIDVRVPSEVLFKPAGPPRVYAGAGGAGVARMGLYSGDEGPAFNASHSQRRSSISQPRTAELRPRPVASGYDDDEQAVRQSIFNQPPLAPPHPVKPPKPTVRGHDFAGASAVALVRSSLHQPAPNAQVRPSAPPAEDNLLALALGDDGELNKSQPLRNLTPTRTFEL